MPNLYDENNRRINGYAGKNYMSKRIGAKNGGRIYQEAEEKNMDIKKQPVMSVNGKVKCSAYILKEKNKQ